FILALALVSGLSLVALVFRELRHDDPIVDLPLLKNKAFSASMGAMFVTGFILLSSTQLLPQFLQTLMGYTATRAGLALTSGGLATLVLMPVAGALIRKVQPKILIG